MRKSELIGHKIVDVEWRPFHRGRSRGWATNPVLVLDNGRRLFFVVQETEVDKYGIQLCLSQKPRKG